MKRDIEKEQSELGQENEIDNRINKLYGIKQEKTVPTRSMSDEEAKEIRKKMILSIWIVMIVAIIMICNFTNAFDFSRESEQNVVIDEPEKLPYLPSGDVAIENDEIQVMTNLFKFDVNNPLYEENILKLYKESITLEEMDFETIMFLVTSNNTFNNYIYNNTKLKDYIPQIKENAEISITVEYIDKIIKEILGDGIDINYQSFKYYYDFGINGNQYFDVVLDDGIYIFNPIEPLQKSKIEVYSEPIAASNIDDEIHIRYNTIFMYESGIYTDVQMKNYLGNNKSEIDLYISSGSAIEFIYRKKIDIDNSKISYHLKNIFVVSYGERVEK